ITTGRREGESDRHISSRRPVHEPAYRRHGANANDSVRSIAPVPKRGSHSNLTHYGHNAGTLATEKNLAALSRLGRDDRLHRGPRRLERTAADTASCPSRPADSKISGYESDGSSGGLSADSRWDGRRVRFPLRLGEVPSASRSHLPRKVAA